MAGDIPATTERRGTGGACLRCRSRKVRCSGSRPCTNCQRRSSDCQFDLDEKKVVISERLLHELQQRSDRASTIDEGLMPAAKRPRINQELDTERVNNYVEAVDPDEPAVTVSSRAGSPVFTVDNPALPVSRQSIEHEIGHGTLRNPLLMGPSSSLTDAVGRRRWLGPSSTWAFSRQILRLMRAHLHEPDNHSSPLHVDAEAFKIDWPSRHNSRPPLKTRIPSLDHAIYLTHTVDFHLGHAYHLFDKECFLTSVNNFYKLNLTPEPELESRSRLWYTHFLVIMALGQALLGSKSANGYPAGSDLISRALDLMPDTHCLYDDPLQSVETLCCLSLYLQSVDHRNSAYLYIGQALRIALTQGFHREHPEGTMDAQEAHRIRCVWWTIYILDRKFSSLMGAPTSIRDEDITVELPNSSEGNDEPQSLKLHVALSKRFAKVLHTVYGVSGDFDRRFLKNIQGVLRELADLSPEIETSFKLSFDDSEPASRLSATLNLFYHQCVVLATRPILLCLMEDLLKVRRNNYVIANPIKALLNTSYESATMSLRILSWLQSQNLLETFLPFDLEQTFSSSFVLILISNISGQSDGTSTNYIDTSMDILSEMISRGNSVARFRKDDLQELQGVASLMQAELRLSRHPSLGDIGSMLTQNTQAPGADPETSGTSTFELVAAATGFGGDVVSENLLSLNEFLEWEPDSIDIEAHQLPADWLWADAAPEAAEFMGNIPEYG